MEPGVLRRLSASAGLTIATRRPVFRSSTTPTAGESRSAEESALCAVDAAAPIKGEAKNKPNNTRLCLSNKLRVPHISLVFREMSDTTELTLKLFSSQRP